LPRQSATAALARTVTVAEGVYAPGHLGELTQHVPFDLVDAVLEETETVEKRLRDLPSRVGVYFLLALGLFPHLGYARVRGKLVAGLAGLPVPAPSEKALRDLRRRLGPAPVKELFEVLAGPLAQPTTPGVRYRRLRTVAFDGCSSPKVPDAERNRDWPGRIRYRLAWAGYPALMLMALVETGTRGLVGAVFGPAPTGEPAYAGQLLHLPGSDTLVLADRNFDGNSLLRAIAATGSQFLVRGKASRRPPILAKLPDGSFLSKLDNLPVRFIDADITVTTADGHRIRGRYRLITTLLDHRHDPAPALIRLYHERWEIESAFSALRHTLMTGRNLRSTDPVGVEQEMRALLTLYQALRIAMVAAVESRPGTDPDRAAFTTALESARDLLIAARGVLPDNLIDPVGDIGRAVLADLLPARRPRTSTRRVKCPLSRYQSRPVDPRPETSQKIATVTITVHEPNDIPPLTGNQPAHSWSAQARRLQADPGTPPGSAARTSTRERVLTLLRTDPQRDWRTRDIAQTVDIEATGFDAFRKQMLRWSKQGMIRKTGPGTYRLTEPTTSP